MPLCDISRLGDGDLADAPVRDIPARVRSTHPSREATFRTISETEAVVELLSVEDGAAPGQACVFHETGCSRSLGEGWIWRGN